jgi:hypothetical protein
MGIIFSKKLTLKYSGEVKSLLSNNYIEKEQDIEYLMAVYRLHKKMFAYLTKKMNSQIKDHLRKLTATEKIILDMFYEEQSGLQYEHKWIDKLMYQSIIELNNKKIIIYDKLDDKFIKISDYVVKLLLEDYRTDKILRDIIFLNPQKIAAQGKGGSGANPNPSLK